MATKSAQVIWIDKQQYIGVDSSRHSVVLSAQDDENGTGISPSELLPLSLAGCISYDVVNILKKKRQKITGLNVTVTTQQDSDPPWVFRKMSVHFEVKGIQLSEKAVQDAIHIAESKYCSISATLRETVEIVYDYVIKEEL
jgi:putative redox protein